MCSELIDMYNSFTEWILISAKEGYMLAHLLRVLPSRCYAIRECFQGQIIHIGEEFGFPGVRTWHILDFVIQRLWS